VKLVSMNDVGTTSATVGPCETTISPGTDP
jgi:hypothetical protein